MTSSERASGTLTASVFSSGAEIHLRGRFNASEKIVPVISQGVRQPANELVVQWTAESGSSAQLPRPGQPVQFYTVVGGVLHIAKGEVIKLSDAPSLSIRSKVEEYCLAIPLRRHPRYHAFGRLQLAEPAAAAVNQQEPPQPMDISLGGFGATVAGGEWRSGQELAFQLQLWVDVNGRPAEVFSQLELGGSAIIRNTAPGTVAGTTHIGAQFQELAAARQATLELWLAACAAYLRQT